MKLLTMLLLYAIAGSAFAGSCHCKFLGKSERQCKETIGECKKMCDEMNPAKLNPPPAMSFGSGSCTAPTSEETPQLSLSTEPSEEDLTYQAELGATSIAVATGAVGRGYSHAAGHPTYVTLKVATLGREVLGVRVYMKNSNWPNNCIIEPGNQWVNVGPSRPWALPWSSTSAVDKSSDAVAVTFGNWSDCNTRGAKVVAFLK